jgi:hypothetical protein
VGGINSLKPQVILSVWLPFGMDAPELYWSCGDVWPFTMMLVDARMR